MRRSLLVRPLSSSSRDGLVVPVADASSWKEFVRQNVGRLRSSKCLLVQSSSLPESSSNKKRNEFMQRLNQSVERNVSVSRLQYNIPIVPMNISSAVPTLSELKGGVELAQRSGTTMIVGMGSGSAMDLAKSISISTNQPCILCPNTLGGIMASSNPIPLHLDPHEEALLPAPWYNQSTLPEMEIVLDSQDIILPFSMERQDNIVINKERRDDATYSGASSCPTLIDATLSSLVISTLSSDNNNNNNDDDDIRQSCMQTCISLLKQIDTHIHHSSNGNDGDGTIDFSKEFVQDCTPNAILAMRQAGQLFMQQNNNDNIRSIPLALTCALLPKYFPHANMISFTSSMVHALSSLEIPPSLFPYIPRMSSFVEGTPNLEEMMDFIDTNAALINCQDHDPSILQHILSQSLQS